MIILQLYKLFSLSIHLGLWYQHFLFYHATYLDIRLMSSYKMMWLMNLSNPCFRYWLLTYSLIVSVCYSTEYNRTHIQYIPLSHDWHKLFNAHGYCVLICFRAKSIFSLLWQWYGRLKLMLKVKHVNKIGPWPLQSIDAGMFVKRPFRGNEKKSWKFRNTCFLWW